VLIDLLNVAAYRNGNAAETLDAIGPGLLPSL